MRSIHFTKAQDKDLDYLAEVLESILPMYKPILPGVFERQIDKFRNQGKFSSKYEIWLILNLGDPIGFIGLDSLSSEVIYFAAFYIHADYHRLGFGSRTMEMICNSFKDKGYKEILLFAHFEANWAIQFYLELGFEKIATDYQEILKYRDGLLKGYFLPRPVLMRRKLY
ncbi:MAG: GNAT family N-acetyltransferase [Halanaerobiales bacterium]|nr:GNAT family N-acetyltransferase [Halanaerobiales bacterium]